MPYNEKLVDRIREALQHLPKVEEKKMFRGVTFMVAGILDQHDSESTLFFKIILLPVFSYSCIACLKSVNE